MKAEELTGQVSSHLAEVSTLHQTLLAEQKVHHDLIALVNSAHSAGFQLEIASGFRDFSRQLHIWNGKFSGQRTIFDTNSHPLDPSTLSDEEKLFAILRWSALPGASRHHWGTDFDIYAKNLLPSDCSLQLEPWEYLDGHQSPFYQWLKEHLAGFGFFFPYAQDLGGVAPEPWHISHITRSREYMETCSPQVLAQAVETSSIQGKRMILERLETIYTQYIININPAD